MKLKSVLGAVLAGAIALGSTLAYAQGPYYITPKLLYSHQKINSFNSTVSSGVTNSNYNGSDTTDNVFGGGIALGYDWGSIGYSPVRAELEFLARGQSQAEYPIQLSGHYFDAPMSSSHSFNTKIYSLFANVYYDFVNDSDFTPYVGGGLGGAYLDVTSDTTIHSSGWSYDANGNTGQWNFAWNLGGGVAYKVSDNMALDFGYRYSDFGTADSSSRKHHFVNVSPTEQIPIRFKSKADLAAHEFILGLRISGY